MCCLLRKKKAATSTSSNSAIPGNPYSSKINPSQFGVPMVKCCKSASKYINAKSRWQFILVSF